MARDPILERFVQLQRSHSHPPAGRKQMERAIFLLAQLEMYFLAQVLGRTYVPDIQRELDHARRAVMFEMKHHGDSPKTNVVRPYRAVSHVRWSDFQITPEVAGDSELTGKFVSRENADKLRAAHRAQVQEIMRLVKGAM